MINPRDLTSKALDPAQVALKANAVEGAMPSHGQLDNPRVHRDVGLGATLQELVELSHAADPAEIPSHREYIGPVVVFGKKVALRALRPIVTEVLRRQSMFNERLIAALRELDANTQRTTSGRPDAQFRATVTQRLEDLEQRMREVEAEHRKNA